MPARRLQTMVDVNPGMRIRTLGAGILCGLPFKARHRQHAEPGREGPPPPPAGPNSDLEILVTFLIIGVERSDFMRILDLKFLKFELNFEMLTWTFPKSQNLPNLKIFSQILTKSGGTTSLPQVTVNE